MRMGMGTGALRLAVPMLAMAACGAGTDGPTADLRPTVRDSAGVRIVEYGALPVETVPAWSAGSEPLLVLGSASGDEAQEFYQATRAVRTSDGGIAVANSGTGELRFFDARGAYAGAVGRSGQGPGEFQSLTLLGTLPGDSILLFDARNARFSMVGPERTVTRSYNPDGRPALSARGVLASGWTVASGPAGSLGDPTSGTMMAPATPLRLVSPQGMLGPAVDTLPDRPLFFEITDRGMSFTRVPLSAEPAYAVGATSFHAGGASRYEIRSFDGQGALARILRVARPPRTVTAADVQKAIDEALDRASEEARPKLRRSLEDAPWPETMPAYARLLADRLGNLWVEEYRGPGEEGQHWLVYDSVGTVVGSVQAPSSVYVTDIGEDWMLGLGHDAMGEQTVELYDLQRGDSRSGG